MTAKKTDGLPLLDAVERHTDRELWVRATTETEGRHPELPPPPPTVTDRTRVPWGLQVYGRLWLAVWRAFQLAGQRSELRATGIPEGSLTRQPIAPELWGSLWYGGGDALIVGRRPEPRWTARSERPGASEPRIHAVRVAFAVRTATIAVETRCEALLRKIARQSKGKPGTRRELFDRARAQLGEELTWNAYLRARKRAAKPSWKKPGAPKKSKESTRRIDSAV